jgi:hypothetical protein
VVGVGEQSVGGADLDELAEVHNGHRSATFRTTPRSWVMNR